MPIKSTHEHMK